MLPRNGAGLGRAAGPGSRRGVAIGAWRRYRAVEGPLQTALLSLYILVAVLPAVLVMEEYLDPHPNSLANSLVHHYRLNASTSELIHNVLGEGRSHELGSALFAIVGALVFGVGFGHVLQLVYARAWQLDLKTGVVRPARLRRRPRRPLRAAPAVAGAAERLPPALRRRQGRARYRLGRIPDAVLRRRAVAADAQAGRAPRPLARRRPHRPRPRRADGGLALCHAVLGRSLRQGLRRPRSRPRHLLLDRDLLRDHRLGRKPLSGARGAPRGAQGRRSRTP